MGKSFIHSKMPHNATDGGDIGEKLKDNNTCMENVYVLERTDQIIELETIIMDRETSHSDFVFYVDRLIRLVVEEGLNRLPYTNIEIETPAGASYQGIAFCRGNCGVSICRGGEAMEQALRQCCRSVRIGKMLIGDDTRLLYARLMPDIRNRRVLLLYPLLSTGVAVIKAVSVLVENGVIEKNILLLTLFATPAGIKQVMNQFPKISILTSDINPLIPFWFATKYFGTD
uniref:Uracil phosphoribosyltransferase n=1 Tax=Setaria digitata TaxID=48799 RepID=A0A915PI02_9BILA